MIAHYHGVNGKHKLIRVSITMAASDNTKKSECMTKMSASAILAPGLAPEQRATLIEKKKESWGTVQHASLISTHFPPELKFWIKTTEYSVIILQLVFPRICRVTTDALTPSPPTALILIGGSIVSESSEAYSDSTTFEYRIAPKLY